MELKLDPLTTSLMLIDFQRSNVARQLAPHSSATIVGNAARLVQSFRENAALIVFAQVLVNELLDLPADMPFPKIGGTPADAAEIVAEVGIRPGDYLISKRQWGAFYATELEQLLSRRRTRTIVLCGIATNFGVESTARAAFDRGFKLVFAEDAMSSISTDSHVFSTVQLFPRIGRVRSTAQLLQAW